MKKCMQCDGEVKRRVKCGACGNLICGGCIAFHGRHEMPVCIGCEPPNDRYGMRFKPLTKPSHQ